MDPKNPPIAARLDACRKLRDAGIPVRLHVAPLQPHSEDFPRIAAEVADWVWIDYPCHLSVAGPAYRQRDMGDYLSRSWVERQAEKWRVVLGEARVGVGQTAFARRTRSLRP
jgi:hypothetical protein